MVFYFGPYNLQIMLTIRLQVYTEHLLWALKFVNNTYFGLFGSLGMCVGCTIKGCILVFWAMESTPSFAISLILEKFVVNAPTGPSGIKHPQP